MGVGGACGSREGSRNLQLLPPHLPPPLPSVPEVPETIELEVRTSTANGLLLWQGVVSVGVWPGLRVPGGQGCEATAAGALAPRPGTPATLCFPGRTWARPAVARTSSVLGFRTGTWSSGGSGHLALPPPIPGPSHPFSGLPSARCRGSSRKKLQPPAPQPHTPPPSAPAHTVLGLHVCSYQLGSGEARLVSEDPIDDGEWHRVTALR